jgi:hypothetical protein
MSDFSLLSESLTVINWSASHLACSVVNLSSIFALKSSPAAALSAQNLVELKSPIIFLIVESI